MTDPDREVFLVGNHGSCAGNRRVYHTREDCRSLADASDYRKITLNKLNGHFHECRTCQNGGELPTHDGRGEGHYDSLVKAAKRGDWS